MDLLEFETTQLYFEQAPSVEVEALLEKASYEYGSDAAEAYLKKAYLLAPENLSVLVALYRFYFYTHRLEEALEIAEQAVNVSAKRLGLTNDWQTLNPSDFDRHNLVSEMGLIRYYLLAIKGAAVLCLRLGRLNEAITRLRKLVMIDAADHLGVRDLLELALKQEKTQLLPNRY